MFLENVLVPYNELGAKISANVYFVGLGFDHPEQRPGVERCIESWGSAPMRAFAYQLVSADTQIIAFDDVKNTIRAEEKFKEASEAYGILSDKEKKQNYDNFGHAAFENGGGRPGGGFGGFLKSMAKSALGGESFFLNTYTAGPQGGWISLAPV